MVRYWVATVALVGVVGGSSAAAQETRRLDIGLRGVILHDSNIARSDATLAAQRGIKPEDVVFTPSLTFDLLLPISRQSFFLTGTAGYDFHQENDRLDSERLTVNSGFNARFGRCNGVIAGGYSRSQSDLQDLTLVNPENIREVTSADISLGCSRATGLGGQLSLGQEWGKNSNLLQKQSNYETTSGQASITYARPRLGTLTFFAQRQRTEFDDVVGTISKAGYDLTAYGASFDRRLGARIQGTLSVSYSKVDPLNSTPAAASSDYTGMTYGADFSFKATDRLEALLTYERSIVPSARIGKLYDIEEDARIEARYQLGSRFQIGLGGQLLDVESEGTTLPATGLLLTDSRTKIAFGSLTFKQSQRTSLRLDVSREEREANSPIYEYSTTRVAVTADVAF